MSRITVRTAQAEDKPTVLAFCAHTWESGDYIERVWDDWLVNPNGHFFVATSDNIPVGIVHLNMLTPTDAWLEGLRVNSDYRRQGIARALYESALVEAMRRQATYVRLVTDADNTPSIRLSESIHMRLVGSFVSYTAPPLDPTPKQRVSEKTQLATPDDLDMIIDYLNVSNIFPLTGGLYYVGFTAQPITAEFLADKIAAGHIHLLRRWDRLDGLAIAEPRFEYEEQRLSIGYLDGMTIDAISFIAYDLRQHLTPQHLDKVRIYAPDFVLMHDALNGIDYTTRAMIFQTYERGLL